MKVRLTDTDTDTDTDIDIDTDTDTDTDQKQNVQSASANNEHSVAAQDSLALAKRVRDEPKQKSDARACGQVATQACEHMMLSRTDGTGKSWC